MRSEIEKLIYETIDQTISDADFEVLQQELDNDAEVREQYLRAVVIAEDLEEIAQSESADSRAAFENTSVTKAFWRFSSVPGFVSALAMVLLIGLMLGYVFTRIGPSTDDELATRNPHLEGASSQHLEPAHASDSHAEPADRNVDDEASSGPLYLAQVIAASGDVVWKRTSRSPDFLLRARRNDRIEIRAGLVELEYYSGAKLILHGPCAFVVSGEKSGWLEHGQLTGKVDGGDFQLTTPSATVIDLGTEFGVLQRKTNTEVSVFDGEVKLLSGLSEDAEGYSLSMTEGMSAKVGMGRKVREVHDVDTLKYVRAIPNDTIKMPGEVSLVDLLSASTTDRFALTGVIAPATGLPDRTPWLKPRGPGHRTSDIYRETSWHPYVDGVFIPSSSGVDVQIDSVGGKIALPASTGRTWGPIWSRRRVDSLHSVGSLEDYWGTSTLKGVMERLSECEAGMIGIHSNVGVTFDLDKIRESQGDPRVFRTVVSNLDNSRITSPKWAEINRFSADLRVLVDGELRASRLDFTRDDGESTLEVDLNEGDRFLTLISSDAGALDKRNSGKDGFDHVVLIDPVLYLIAEVSK